MKCNNKYCTWCSFDICCHESIEGHENAVPNQLDCPSSLRCDFELQLETIYNICVNGLGKLSFDNLVEVNKLIETLAEKRFSAMSRERVMDNET